MITITTLRDLESYIADAFGPACNVGRTIDCLRNFGFPEWGTDWESYLEAEAPGAVDRAHMTSAVLRARIDRTLGAQWVDGALADVTEHCPRVHRANGLEVEIGIDIDGDTDFYITVRRGEREEYAWLENIDGAPLRFRTSRSFRDFLALLDGAAPGSAPENAR